MYTPSKPIVTSYDTDGGGSGGTPAPAPMAGAGVVAAVGDDGGVGGR